MLNNVQNNISTGFKFCLDVAMDATSRAGQLALNLPSAVGSTLITFIPDVKPRSLSDVIHQIQKEGSALFQLDRGDLLIEIVKDSEGRSIFKAADPKLKATVIAEGDESNAHTVWEVKVADYLKKFYNDESLHITYGICNRRWKKSSYEVLKTSFNLTGSLQKRGQKVKLQLPGDDEPIFFSGPYAEHKADIVLKKFYTGIKTPAEEEESSKWDFLKSLFLGYLSISGKLLAPFVNNFRLQDPSESDSDITYKLGAKGFLENNDLFMISQNDSLRKTVKSFAEVQANKGNGDLLEQLNNIQFTADGYSQTYDYEGKTCEEIYRVSNGREIVFRRVHCKGQTEELISEKSNERLTVTERSHLNGKTTTKKATYKHKNNDWERIPEESDQKPKELKTVDQSHSGSPKSSKYLEKLRKAKVNQDDAAITLGQHLRNGAALAAGSALAAMTTNLVTKDSKATFLVGVLSLLQQAQALQAVSDEAKTTHATATRELARRAASDTISINVPLTSLTGVPGSQITENIDLRQSFALSDPNANAEIYITQTDGTPVPGFSLDIDMVTRKSLRLTDTAQQSVMLGNYTYVVGYKGIYLIDTTNPSQPAFLESYPEQPIDTLRSQSLCAIGNTVYFGYCDQYGNNMMSIYSKLGSLAGDDISLHLDNNQKFVTMAPSGLNSNVMYVIGQDPSTNLVYLNIIYLNNLQTTTASSLIGAGSPSNGNINVGIFKQNVNTFYGAYPKEYIYVNLGVVDYTSPEGNIKIIDPKYGDIFGAGGSLKIISAINTGISPHTSLGGGGIAVYNNFMFIAIPPYLTYWDISNPSSPSAQPNYNHQFFMNLGDSGSNRPINLIASGGNLYIPYGDSGLITIKIQDILDFRFVSNSFSTKGSAVFMLLNGNNAYISDGNFLTIADAGKRIFSGTQAGRGLIKCNVTGKDDSGNETPPQPLAIHVGDINKEPIPDQRVNATDSGRFAINATAFELPGADFRYTANLADGQSLPSFINFTQSAGKFEYNPVSGDQGIYDIQVNADDGWGGKASQTFTLTVPDRAPVVFNPLDKNQTAYIQAPYRYTIPDNSTAHDNAFTDIDGDTLRYSAVQQGLFSLPEWLHFDASQRLFYGTPTRKGVFQIEVTADDGFGKVAKDTFTITVPNTPPKVLNPPSTQTATAGRNYTYTVNSDVFYDIDGDPITLSTNETALPGFLKFNSTTGILSGYPVAPKDIGFYSNTLYGTDPNGKVAETSFNLNVISPDIPKTHGNFKDPAPVKVGHDFSIQFPLDYFYEDESLTLTYEATLEDQSQWPLGINFDPKRLIFSGNVKTPQNLRILVTATNNLGGTASVVFNLNIVQNSPPVVQNSLVDYTAHVGREMSYEVPLDTFFDADGDHLNLTVTRADGSALPGWMHWDPATKLITGKPGHWDTGTFHQTVVPVAVRASDGEKNSTSTFRTTVTGKSFNDLVITTTVSIISAAISIFGGWQKRTMILNYLTRDGYREKDPQIVLVGQEFKYDLPWEFKDVGQIKAFHKGDALGGLPAGLTHKGKEISGIPLVGTEGRFTICVYDKVGYCVREFDLVILKSAKSEVPPEELGRTYKPVAAVYKVTRSAIGALPPLPALQFFGKKKVTPATQMTVRSSVDDGAGAFVSESNL